jgi:NADPH:quinone reductase-like Zn-dependent oxidoreductase
MTGGSHPIPAVMHAVLLTGHGGPEKLEYRTDYPVPRPADDEVLVRVSAAGVNNTDINTRTGWYSKSVSGSTGDSAASGGASEASDASWTGAPFVFPRIQGADLCGRIVAVGNAVPPTRIGQRVIAAALQQAPAGGARFATWTLGSECDGAFAQYAVVRSAEAHEVTSNLSDAELGAIPCAYSTAEGLLERARLAPGESVLITGASGGVGLAAVSLAKLRGANVIAQTSPDKAPTVMESGADRTIGRGAAEIAAIGQVDLVIDVVAGEQWPALLDALERGGRYAVAGAIAGPVVSMDVRTVYLKDLTLFGCTYQPPAVFEAIVGYVNSGRLRPLVSKTYPLRQIAEAQADFIAKKHPGKLVLLPPHGDRP